MNCPACGSVLADTASTCGSCQADARLTVLGKGGQTYGPYTASQLAQYVRAGKIPAGAALEDSQGNRTTPTRLGLAEDAPAAPTPPAARAAPTPPAGLATPPARAAPVGPVPRPTAQPPAKKSTGKTCATIGGVGCGCLIIVGIILAILLAPVLKRASEVAKITICMGQAEMLGDAVLQYAGANNKTMPNAATWQQDIQQYLPDPDMLDCPASGLGAESYAFNPTLSGVSTSTITDPETTPLIYDAAYADGSPGPHDGDWVVCYADAFADIVEPTTATP